MRGELGDGYSTSLDRGPDDTQMNEQSHDSCPLIPQDEKSAAQARTQPLLDALDTAYDEPCEVTQLHGRFDCLSAIHPRPLH